mmetsp:Transcript_10643/g.24710  ORF Transcript_10643/g.24710 Transcript_10643/m.24710 type:complete len:84 (-) Transcript_10643:365-616(-)
MVVHMKALLMAKSLKLLLKGTAARLAPLPSSRTSRLSLGPCWSNDATPTAAPRAVRWLEQSRRTCAPLPPVRTRESAELAHGS